MADSVKGTDLPLVVFAQELTAERLIELGRQYLISNLRLSPLQQDADWAGVNTGSDVLEDAGMASRLPACCGHRRAPARTLLQLALPMLERYWPS